MQFSGPQKKLLIYGGIGLLLLIGLGLLLNLGKPNSNEVRVTVAVVPSDSSLTIDGKDSKAGQYTLTKAKHTFKATRQDFGDVVRTIDLSKWDPTQTIYLLPEPNSDKAKQYMTDHPDEQAARERGVAIDVSNSQEQIIENYPVVQNLPHQTTDYRMDYTVNADKSISFQVVLYASYPTPDNQAEVQQQLIDFKNEARQYLKDNGVDPDKVSITYTQG